jgi:hypothetical protein
MKLKATGIDINYEIEGNDGIAVPSLSTPPPRRPPRRHRQATDRRGATEPHDDAGARSSRRSARSRSKVNPPADGSAV